MRKFTSSMVDGELISCQKPAAAAFSRPRRGGLYMRRRLPDLWVGLAAIFAVIADRFWFWIIKSTSA